MLFYGLEHNDDFVGFAYVQRPFKKHNKPQPLQCDQKISNQFFFASTVNLCEDHAQHKVQSASEVVALWRHVPVCWLVSSKFTAHLQTEI